MYTTAKPIHNAPRNMHSYTSTRAARQITAAETGTFGESPKHKVTCPHTRRTGKATHLLALLAREVDQGEGEGVLFLAVAELAGLAFADAEQPAVVAHKQHVRRRTGQAKCTHQYNQNNGTVAQHTAPEANVAEQNHYNQDRERRASIHTTRCANLWAATCLTTMPSAGGKGNASTAEAPPRVVATPS